MKRKIKPKKEEPPVEACVDPTVAKRSFRFVWGFILVAFLVFGVGGGWIYFSKQKELRLLDERRMQRAELIKQAQLDDARQALSDAKAFLSQRNWEKLDEKVKRAKALDLDSRLSSEFVELEQMRVVTMVNDLRDLEIKEGLQLGKEKITSNDFEGATDLYKNLLLKYPNTKDIEEAQLSLVGAQKAHREEARKNQISILLDHVHDLLARKDWQGATANLTKLKQLEFEGPALLELVREIQSVEAEEKAQLLKAEIALKALKEKDQGKYSQELMDEIDLALIDAPNLKELKEFRSEVFARVQLVKVPEDVASLAEAMEQVRDGDEILLGEGVFPGNIIVNKGVKIRGKGAGKTSIIANYDTGPGFVFQRGNSLLEHVEVRGAGVGLGDQGYAGILLQHGSLSVRHTVITHSPGHGIVVSGGSLTAKSCVIEDPAWNGLSVYGKGSSAVLEDVSIRQACRHGVEIWDGASAHLNSGVSIESCDRTGVVVTGADSALHLVSTLIAKNRESGVAVASKATLVAKDVRSVNNLFSGLTGSGQGTKVSLEGLVAHQNGQNGVWLGPKVDVVLYRDCSCKENGLRQADLPR